jgi:hypothetical protein
LIPSLFTALLSSLVLLLFPILSFTPSRSQSFSLPLEFRWGFDELPDGPGEPGHQ